MNINSKNYIFGLGMGIIIMSFILFSLYCFSYKPMLEMAYNTMPNISDAEVEQMARDMGMIYAKELPEKTILANDISNVAKMQKIDTNPIEKSQAYLGDYVEVAIPAGANAEEISIILAQNGVVDNAENFENFLKDNNATKKINSGTFDFPLNGTYEQVADVCIQ